MGKEIKPHQPEYWDDKLPNLAAAMRSMGIRASDKIPPVGIYHAFYNGDHVLFQVHDGGFRIINYHGEKNDAPKLNMVKYLDESPSPSLLQPCNHEALIDTGIGYNYCPMCKDYFKANPSLLQQENERLKARVLQLQTSFKSLLDQIDARGYRNDFSEQREILNQKP